MICDEMATLIKGDDEAAARQKTVSRSSLDPERRLSQRKDERHTGRVGMDEPRPQIDWIPSGKPAWRGGWMNGYASGLASVLGFLGHEVDYDQVMGDLGVAFITQGEENSTNRFDGAVDVGWWPLESLAIIRLNFLEGTVGREIRDIKLPASAHDPVARASYDKWFEPALCDSLERRAPAVVRVGSTEYIVTGCDDHAEYPLIGMCPNEEAGKERIYRIEEPLPPYVALTFGQAQPTLDRAAADREALRFAIMLHRDQVLGVNYDGRYALRRAEEYGGAWRTGLKSYAAWIACLEDTEHPGQPFWHGNVVRHLRLNRESAIRYLTALQRRQAATVAEHLGAAIEIYRAIVEEVGRCDASKQAPSGLGGRQALVAHIREIMRLETRAVEQIERAVAALDGV